MIYCISKFLAPRQRFLNLTFLSCISIAFNYVFTIGIKCFDYNRGRFEAEKVQKNPQFLLQYHSLFEEVADTPSYSLIP